MGLLKKLGKSGMFGLAGLAATNKHLGRDVKKLGKAGMLGVAGLAATDKDLGDDLKRIGKTGMFGLAPALAIDEASDDRDERDDQNSFRGYKRGGKISAVEAVHKHERNMHKGKKPTKFAKGGSASRRGDGIAQKGKTKGRMC